MLDGPCGRPMSLRDASWASEARFIGLCGADAVLGSRCAGVGAAGLVDISILSSRLSEGAGELRNSPVKPKMLRFLDCGSMMSLVEGWARVRAKAMREWRGAGGMDTVGLG